MAGPVHAGRRAATRDRRRHRVLAGRREWSRVRRDGNSGPRRRDPRASRLRGEEHAAQGRGNHAAASPRASHRQADSDRHLGRRVVGDRLLSAERIHARLRAREEQSPQDVLVDSGSTDRNVGRACRSTVDGESLQSAALAALRTLAPELDRAVETLRRCSAAWAVAGGWAIDLFVGRQTRDHADLDIAVWRDDQHLLRACLETEWQLDVAENHQLRPWRVGESLSLPLFEIHARLRREPGQHLELLLNDRDAHSWIFRRDPRITYPLPRTFLTS